MAEPAVKEKTVPPVKKMAAHPKISVMVNSAIMSLDNKRGSSLHAINKYISDNYDADPQKMSHHIKKYLKSSVESGELIQPTGTGARGSFKIGKQKPLVEPKALKAKPSNRLIMTTSAPYRTLKPKKASKMQNKIIPDESHVKSMASGCDEEAPAEATFTMPNTSLTKRPKVAVKTKIRKARVSLPEKVKKPKKLVTKKIALVDVLPGKEDDPQKLAHHTKNLDSANQIGELVQPTEKGASCSSKIREQSPLVEPKEPTVKPSKVPRRTAKMTLKPEETSKIQNEGPVKSTEEGYDEEAPADAEFTTPNTDVTKRPKVAVKTKIRKARVSLPVKVKKPKKLVTKKIALVDVLPGKEDDPTKILNESPVKSTKARYEEEAPANATFSTPIMNMTKKLKAVKTKAQKSRVLLHDEVKKPEKSMKKVTLPEVVPKEEPRTPSTFVKPPGTPYPKSKKNVNKLLRL